MKHTQNSKSDEFFLVSKLVPAPIGASSEKTTFLCIIEPLPSYFEKKHFRLKILKIKMFELGGREDGRVERNGGSVQEYQTGMVAGY